MVPQVRGLFSYGRGGDRLAPITNVAPAADTQRYDSWRCVIAVSSQRRAPLPAQAKLLDQRAVASDVLAGQVLEQPAPAADEQQQSVAAVVIVLVHLQVLGQTGDPLGQQRDLDLRRAGVTLTCRVRGDDLLLDFGVERHSSLLVPSCGW